MQTQQAVVVKLGGSLLRERSYRRSRESIEIIASLASQQMLLLLNGSLDLPSTIEAYLAHLGRPKPRIRLEVLSREIVGHFLASECQGIDVVHSVIEAEDSWRAGRAPLLSAIAIAAIAGGAESSRMSSTGFAYLLAAVIGAREFVVLTDVDGVWKTADRVIAPLLTTDELRGLATCCVDIALADLIDRYEIPVSVINGTEPRTVRAFFEGNRSGVPGSAIVKGGGQSKFEIGLLASYLNGEGFVAKGDLRQARQVSALRLDDAQNWALRSAFTVESTQNAAAYTIAVGLERLGSAVASGLLPIPLVLALASDQICEDWLACSAWVKGYRDSGEGGFLEGFRRRYAETLFVVCRRYLLRSYSPILSERLRSELEAERIDESFACESVAAEALELSKVNLRPFLRD